MTPFLDILGRAARDLLRPRILAVVLIPSIAATAVWVLAAWLFWDTWAAWVQGLLGSMRWLENWSPAWLLHSLALVITIIVVVPLIFVTALVITEIIAMPVIVSVVGERYYSGLEKRHGGTAAGSVLNSAIAICIFAVSWVVTLPLWLFGVTALLLPALLSAYLNQRLFRYDALSEHAAPEEYRLLCKRSRGKLYLLGLLLAALYYVPVFNFLVPVLSGLAFTHLCLAELASLRAEDRR